MQSQAIATEEALASHMGSSGAGIALRRCRLGRQASVTCTEQGGFGAAAPGRDVILGKAAPAHEQLAANTVGMWGLVP